MDDVQSTEQQRPDYLSQIWSICTTLSSEAIDAAESKAKANQFNIDRGDVPFAEIAINLTSAREILIDAIEEKKLIQLPITVQRELLSNLQTISKTLQGIMNNADEIVNFGSAVETLNTSIWKYGLHNLSEQVLGYQVKLNQLKQQDVRTKNLLATLEGGRALSENLAVLAKRAESDLEQTTKSRILAEEEASAASSFRQQAQEEMTKTTNSAASAAQADAQIVQYSSAAKTAATNIGPLEDSITGFFSEIDSHRKQMANSTDEISKFLTESGGSFAKSLSETNTKITSEIERWNAAAKGASEEQALALNTEIESNRTALAELMARFNKKESERIKEATEAAANQLAAEEKEHVAFNSKAEAKLSDLETDLKARSEATIEANYQATTKHVEELARLKESVKEQVAQATGLGQFGAFQSRQNKISDGKRFWVVAIGLLVAAVVTLTYFIALHAQQGDLHSAGFWIKLSMNIPLGFLITFCTIQYNRERRLEEEYAFKASISVSLNPYRELIYSILEKDGALKDGSYTSFVIDSVRNVFTSPTEKIFDSPKKLEGISEKSLKASAELIGTAVKAAK